MEEGHHEVILNIERAIRSIRAGSGGYNVQRQLVEIGMACRAYAAVAHTS